MRVKFNLIYYDVISHTPKFVVCHLALKMLYFITAAIKAVTEVLAFSLNFTCDQLSCLKFRTTTLYVYNCLLIFSNLRQTVRKGDHVCKRRWV